MTYTTKCSKIKDKIKNNKIKDKFECKWMNEWERMNEISMNLIEWMNEWMNESNDNYIWQKQTPKRKISFLTITNLLNQDSKWFWKCQTSCTIMINHFVLQNIHCNKIYWRKDENYLWWCVIVLLIVVVPWTNGIRSGRQNLRPGFHSKRVPVDVDFG